MSIADKILTTYVADRDRLSRLRGEHAVMEHRLTDLHARAKVGQWDDLDEVWSAFARDLEAHMRFEERDLFDLLVREHPEHQIYVAELRLEHAQIRMAVERLGIEIQLHLVRSDSVNALLETLARHAKAEERIFHPWLEEKVM